MTCPRTLGCLLACAAALAPAPGRAKESAPAAAPTPSQLVQQALGHLVFRAGGAEMTIRLELRGGDDQRSRTMQARTRKVDGQSRTLVRLLAPSDLAGTAFLFVQRAGGEDEQYMYLPSLKVSRRIVGNQKQSSFLGSDFSYADLEFADLDDAACTLGADEKVGEHPCHVITCQPRHQPGAVRLYVRRKDQAPLRVVYLDGRGAVRKTLFVKTFQPVGQTLMATELKMVDEASGHHTVLSIGEIRLRDDLPAQDFTVQALKPR